MHVKEALPHVLVLLLLCLHGTHSVRIITNSTKGELGLVSGIHDNPKTASDGTPLSSDFEGVEPTELDTDVQTDECGRPIPPEKAKKDEEERGKNVQIDIKEEVDCPKYPCEPEVKQEIVETKGKMTVAQKEEKPLTPCEQKRLEQREREDAEDALAKQETPPTNSTVSTEEEGTKLTPSGISFIEFEDDPCKDECGHAIPGDKCKDMLMEREKAAQIALAVAQEKSCGEKYPCEPEAEQELSPGEAMAQLKEQYPDINFQDGPCAVQRAIERQKAKSGARHHRFGRQGISNGTEEVKLSDFGANPKFRYTTDGRKVKDLDESEINMMTSEFGLEDNLNTDYSAMEDASMVNTYAGSQIKIVEQDTATACGKPICDDAAYP